MRRAGIHQRCQNGTHAGGSEISTGLQGTQNIYHPVPVELTGRDRLRVDSVHSQRSSNRNGRGLTVSLMYECCFLWIGEGTGGQREGHVMMLPQTVFSCFHCGWRASGEQRDCCYTSSSRQHSCRPQTQCHELETFHAAKDIIFDNECVQEGTKKKRHTNLIMHAWLIPTPLSG